MFCLRPKCHQRQHMHIIVTTTPETARKHSSKKLPSPEVRELFGQRCYVTADDYLALYQK